MAEQITNVSPNLIKYIKYVDSMKFDEAPDYKYLMDLFNL